jgi:MYXO-CTERM domain-containing protein
LIVAGSESTAAAYSYESAISTGCHERITMGALRTLRTQVANAPAVTPDSNDLSLITDVPFTLDGDMKDLASASLVIGVRDNDLHGRGPTDTSQLAAIHGNPENQKEHCLRAVEDDEPGGSERALETCKAFIRGKLVEALDGLDANGVPDPAHRVDLDVQLSLRGSVTASLPLFWVRLGQAVHTLQDGFTHTFRTPDRMRVRTVLNWIEYVNADEVESRDGPVHRNGLDQCESLDPLRTQNMGVASQASLELMHAVLDAGPRENKLAAVDATLAKYLTFEPGCTAANNWCDAPEQQYQVGAGCGCSMIGGRPGGLAAAGAGMLGIALLVRRRRRVQRSRAGAATLLALPIALACFGAPSLARAQNAPTDPQATPAPATPPATAAAPAMAAAPAGSTPGAMPGNTPPANAPPGAVTTNPQTGAAVALDPNKPAEGVPTVAQAQAEKTEEKHRSFFGVYAAGSGSVTNPALNGQLGLRFRLSELWSVGLDGEIEGWYGAQTKRFRTGVAAVYATGIIHYPLRFQQVNLRSTLNLGTATMLIDLYGAPRGTTGIFFGAVPLGLEWKVGSFAYIIFDVLGVAVPVPQLKGAPFSYPQYRTAVGIELAF